MYLMIINFPRKRLKKFVYKRLKILPHERTEIDAIIKLIQKFKAVFSEWLTLRIKK